MSEVKEEQIEKTKQQRRKADAKCSFAEEIKAYLKGNGEHHCSDEVVDLIDIKKFDI